VVIRSTVWNTIFTDIAAALTTLGQASPAVAGSGAQFAPYIYVLSAPSVSLATGTLDAATLAVILPNGVSNYIVGNVRFANPSGSLAGGSWGLFTGAGATGVTIFPVTSTITIVTSAINTNNNQMISTPATSLTEAYNSGTLYFRVGTAVPGGVVDVLVSILPSY
jgi:hypothetical protein